MSIEIFDLIGVRIIKVTQRFVLRKLHGVFNASNSNFQTFSRSYLVSFPLTYLLSVSTSISCRIQEIHSNSVTLVTFDSLSILIADTQCRDVYRERLEYMCTLRARALQTSVPSPVWVDGYFEPMGSKSDDIMSGMSALANQE